MRKRESQKTEKVPPNNHRNIEDIGEYRRTMDDMKSTVSPTAKSEPVNNWRKLSAVVLFLSLLLISQSRPFFLSQFLSLHFSTSTDPNSSESMTNHHNSEQDPFLVRDVLPTNVRPVNYNLTLSPKFSDFTFDGHAVIKLDVTENTKEIKLNVADIKFTSATITKPNNMASKSISVDEKEETATIAFESELKAGTQVLLDIVFTGVLSDKMAGFYRSACVDEQTKEKKYMAVTQFEPTDARKAFPCWDEPAIKATFDVTLIVPSHMTALSNMNDISTKQLDESRKEVKFATTPIVSTYLIAFVVGELDVIESKTKDERQTLVRVFAPRGQAKQGEFALMVATKTLEFFADYFAIAYPLPKMDLVAIPDFAAGAMENWGLVTYRTVYLLFDEKVSAAKSKQSVAYVVGHELAHQWFGNLVTMEWWSDLWLNEGFATWVGWLAVDHIFPEWNIWTQFVNDDLQRGLKLDALRSSHPIEVPVKNPAEIHQIFDAISYSKGASVIRMLVNYLGEKTFQTGIRNYLQKFKYANARTQDLWDALSAAADGKPVAKLMESWTRQTGYPVVSVKEALKSGKFQLEVKQERFLSSGDMVAQDDKALWFVPLQIVTSKNPKEPASEVLDQKQKTVELDESEFFKINYGHTGFYRVNYPKESLKRIGKMIKDGKLEASDRIGVVTDVFSLAQSGHTSVVDGLELLSNFEKEEDYIVWNEIASELAHLRLVWAEEPKEVTDKLKELSRKIFFRVAKKLSWDYPEKEDFLKTLLRTLAISVAGKSDDPEIIAEAQNRFKEFVAGNEKAIHPNLRGSVFQIVLRNGGAEEWEKVLQFYKETTIADQKVIALGSLGATLKQDLLQRTLELGMSEEVRPQDIIYVFSPVASNPVGRELAWPFVKDKWQTLYDRFYSGSMSLLGRIVSSTTEDFASEKHYKNVEDFFAGKDLPAISRSIQQSLEKIKSNTNWLNRDREAVASWSKKQ